MSYSGAKHQRASARRTPPSRKRTPHRRFSSASELVTAVVADVRGDIFDLKGYAAVGMEGALLTPLKAKDVIETPHGGELMLLPDRIPLLYNLASGRIEAISENPYDPGTPLFPVAAFNSPGYVISHNSAYQETPGAVMLPLFSYGAAGWRRGAFHSAVIPVDDEPRQDLRFMKTEDVVRGVKHLRKALPGNRLRAHLEHCALTYGCPAGKNFFLGRYEAPLPSSQNCNARCLGCLSLQAEGRVHHSQERIAFTPTPEEIADVALYHIQRVKAAVVSFGQGCEGDPLLAASVIAPAVRRIRSRTSEGTINVNTNASLPDALAQLIAAGIDSMRVSMNSFRKPCYEAYFRPRGYRFEDVLASIDLAIARGVHVAINYLNCPGFTDTPEEMAALSDFLTRHPIHFVQWRNLNFDPLRYLGVMNEAAAHSRPAGMAEAVAAVRRRFPGVGHGYFNPPKERFHLS